MWLRKKQCILCKAKTRTQRRGLQKRGGCGKIEKLAIRRARPVRKDCINTMGVLEIVGGVFILVLSVFLCLFILMQEGTRGGGIAALSGGDPDTQFNKSPGRTRNVLLYKATRFLAAVLFVVTIAVHAVSVYG